MTVPKVSYIVVQGKGDPNEEGGAYKSAVGVLYAVDYTNKTLFHWIFVIRLPDRVLRGDHHLGGRMGGAVMSTDELLFFDRLPRFLPVYEALKERLEARYPDMTVKVTKTQISFRSRYVFAMVSLPYRRMKDWPKEYLMVSFGLNDQKKSPRIAQSVEAYPNRWTHHVIVERVEDLNDELLGWLDEAYQFSMMK